MAWGIWKKFKSGARKFGFWLKDKLKKASDIAKKIKPELEKIDTSGWGNKGKQWGDKIIKISDDVINFNDKIEKGDYEGAISYAGRQFIPRFKAH